MVIEIYTYLIYKGSTLTKICNIMTKRPSSLYTEPRQRRLPETRLHIVNKQRSSFPTTIIRQPSSPPPPPLATVRPSQRRPQHGHATSPARNDENGRQSQCEHTSFQQYEDDVARPLMCHIVQTVTTQIVVTVHMNLSKPPDLFSLSLFTQEAGATSPTATWQPITDA